MKITDVKVFPVDEDKLKAYATITFENCFIVRDLKVISGNKGYFIAMPSKKRKDGTFRDVAHPLNSETRKMIEDAVLEVYEAENVVEAPAYGADDHAVEETAPTVEEPVPGSTDTDTADTDTADPDEADPDETDPDEADPDEADADTDDPVTAYVATGDSDLAEEIVSEEIVEQTGLDTEPESATEPESINEPESTTEFESATPESTTEEAPETGEPMKSAADNPTIEQTDDPEKAFGYEE
jgi:stage V sporulation protein G